MTRHLPVGNIERSAFLRPFHLHQNQLYHESFLFTDESGNCGGPPNGRHNRALIFVRYWQTDKSSQGHFG